MEILNEYLENSMIHGLSYISSSKSKTVKLAWAVFVALGFGCAAFIIQSSFSDWSDSPVSTTVTPKPVADFPFPDVAVCSPRGINSALKYDLMTIANASLSPEKRNRMLKRASE